MTVREEIRTLAQLQNLPVGTVQACLDSVDTLLEHYAELVLTHRGLEVITGGVGVRDALIDIAKQHGGRAAVHTFRILCGAFPDAMLGIKLELGPDGSGPTLYVRTVAPTEEVVELLQVPGLGAAVSDYRVLYGVGLQAQQDELVIKTYTLDPVKVAGRTGKGFRSYRFHDGQLIAERKHYLADVAWNDLPQDKAWARIVELGRTAGFSMAGHVAVTEVNGVFGDPKLYVERVGAVPTDWTQR